MTSFFFFLPILRFMMIFFFFKKNSEKASKPAKIHDSRFINSTLTILDCNMFTQFLFANHSMIVSVHSIFSIFGNFLRMSRNPFIFLHCGPLTFLLALFLLDAPRQVGNYLRTFKYIRSLSFSLVFMMSLIISFYTS